MKNVSILDCTLREAPIDNLQWGNLSIHKMLYDLREANVDYIECGFLKDIEYEEGSACFNSVEQIANIIGNKKNTKYVAMIDYGRYDLNKLSKNDGSSIDMIRVCFKKHEIAHVIEYAEKIIEKGYLVSIQHVNTAAYSESELIEFIKEINELQPYAYAIVDTFGSMYKDEVLHLSGLIHQYLDKSIILGFHAHNNLMLANSNCQEFIWEMYGKRSVMVDTSLFGCGRGAGNANTELISQYLNKKYKAEYDINIMLDLIDTVINAAKGKAIWGYSMPYFISGINDTHSFNVKYLTQRHNIRSADLRAIIEKLNDDQKNKYDFNLLDKLYVEYFDSHVDDQREIEYLRNKMENKEILLLAPGKTLNSEQDIIKQFIMEKKPLIIGVNNLINGYKQDMVFFSGIRRYELLLHQNLKENGNPLIIKTSNIKNKLLENELLIDYRNLLNAKEGWRYMDSSIILLLRLLAKCGVRKINIAGLDGYKAKGEAFYNQELETGLSDEERKQATIENADMLRDFHLCNSDVEVFFLTKSVYEQSFRG